MTIFPNPVSNSESITIRFGSTVKGLIIIYLINVFGQRVCHAEMEKAKPVEEFIIPLNNVSRGIYFLHAENNGLKTTQKVIVE